MTNDNINLKDIPYTQWLENALQDLIKMPVEGICMSVVLSNGDIYNNYYNVHMLNKLAIAGLIQQDAMYNSMQVNGLIKNVSEEGDSNGEEEVS